MSEMIERLALAIEATMFAPHELPLDTGLHAKYRETARAVIEAMREPTQEMRLAAVAEWSRPDPTPEHESTLVFNAIWRAMIDAALTSQDGKAQP